MDNKVHKHWVNWLHMQNILMIKADQKPLFLIYFYD